MTTQKALGPGVTCAVVLLVSLCSSPAQEGEAPKEAPRLAPDAFRVFKIDQPVTGRFRFKDPVTGEPRGLVIGEAAPGGRELSGTLVPGGREILSLTARSNGVGYEGSVKELLKACGQDRVPVTDFLLLGDQIILRMDATPPEGPCPFLENPETAMLVLAASPRPVRLLGHGEITSPATRTQLGLEGQPGVSPDPIVASTVLVEGGTEVKFVGRTRGLDGSIWIEVEAIVSPRPGIEPPRGFLRPDQLRVAASLVLVRETEAKP